MLPFLRSDLADLVSYTPQPGGAHSSSSEPQHEQPVPVDRLDTNESPYDLPAELKQKLAWLYQQELEANRYPDGSHGVLKGAIAQYVNESAGLEPDTLTVEHISVGNGSDELIRSVLMATCLGGQGRILVAEPTFSMYKILASTLGIGAIAIPRRQADFEMDLDAARQAIAQSSEPPVRVVFVVHPNSPTGNALTSAELDWLRELPPDILVVIDEAYFEYSQTTLMGELREHPNWLILRTFSKAFRLAAHRVGYGVGHPDLVRSLEKIRLPYNLPTFSQLAAQLALQHRSLILSSVADILQERSQLYTALTQMADLRVWPSAANFLYARLANFSGQNEAHHRALETLVHTLQQQGTQIRHTGGGLRITIGSAAENQRTLKRLQGALLQRFALE